MKTYKVSYRGQWKFYEADNPGQAKEIGARDFNVRAGDEGLLAVVEYVPSASRQVVAVIVKQWYSPPGRDRYSCAELTLLDETSKELVGSPRRFEEFRDVEDLLVRETGKSRDALLDASLIFDTGRPARITLSLNDDQIANLGFRRGERA